MIKIQFSIDLTGSQGRVIGSNESFIKSFEKNDENDNLGWERMEKKENYIFYEKILKNEKCAVFISELHWPV